MSLNNSEKVEVSLKHAVLRKSRMTPKAPSSQKCTKFVASSAEHKRSSANEQLPVFVTDFRFINHVTSGLMINASL